MHIVDLHLGGMPLDQVLVHQALTLTRTFMRRVVGWKGRLVRNARLEVQQQPDCRVAVEVIPMQTFRAQKAQVLIDAQGGDVVYLCFEGNLRETLEVLYG